MPPSLPLIIGHRGASSEAPENTLASFRLAFQEGADGIEADFQLTRDGEIVCLHDAGTGRTAGIDLPVAGSTLAELRRLDVGLWKGERWRGARIPALREVLGALPDGKRLFVELKGGPELVEPVAREVALHTVDPSRLRFLCFDAEVIRLIKKKLPHCRACWLTDYRFRGYWRPSPAEVLATLAGISADGLASRDRAVLDEALVGTLRSRGMEVHVWTVDSPAAARRLCGLGVDSIMTNRPGRLRASLEGKGGRP